MGHCRAPYPINHGDKPRNGTNEPHAKAYANRRNSAKTQIPLRLDCNFVHEGIMPNFVLLDYYKTYKAPLLYLLKLIQNYLSLEPA